MKDRVEDLRNRLRGVYTVPVNDGAGLLDGKNTFTRTFATPPIQKEAAELIKDLWQENNTIVEEYKLLTENLASMQETNRALVRRLEGWQPIETAPKDGSIIDLWVELRNNQFAGSFRAQRYTNMHWEVYRWRGGWRGDDLSHLIGDIRATHWMPLPTPPKQALQQTEKDYD